MPIRANLCFLLNTNSQKLRTNYQKIIDEEFVNNLCQFVPICVFYLTLIPKNYAQIIKNEFMNNLWSIPGHS